MKKILLWAALAVTTLGLTGCGVGKGLSKVISEAGSEEENTQEAEETQEGDRTVEKAESEEVNYDKYNAYIEVNNMMLDRLDLVIGSYFEDVEFQEEFVLIEEEYWCNSLGDYYLDILDAAYEYTEQKPEYPGLDAAYRELYPVAYELIQVLDEVHEYTDMKSYLDDDYAKGKELHAVIWEKINLYFALGETFMNELDAVANEQTALDLATYQEAGYMAHYYAMKTLLTAQEIQAAIYAQGVTDENLIELDIEALQPLYDQFVAEIEECLKYFNDEEQMAAEGWYYDTSDFYTSALKDTKVALSELFQRVKEQEPLTEMDWMVHDSIPRSGTISNFESELSGLIEEYNRL